jgi:hypothetical protein
MIVKEIRDEDFTSYQKPSMVIGFPSCTFKCERECGCKGMCQNLALAIAPDIDMHVRAVVQRYMTNPITSSVICAGLEPFDSCEDLWSFVKHFRCHSDDDIVIFTGYNKEEVCDKVKLLSCYKNIIIKFGRFVPNQQPHYDEVLGIRLASDNQYAERIS